MLEKLIVNNLKNQLSIQEIKEKYNVDEMIESEQEAWKTKEIPHPPKELFEVLKRANENGFTTFVPHFFPKKDFAKKIKWDYTITLGDIPKVKFFHKWPGLGVVPEKRYWLYIKEGSLPTNAAQLYNMWVLIDQIDQSIHNEEYEFKGDGLCQVLHQLRNEFKIHTPYASPVAISAKLLSTTRCGTYWNEIHDHVLPTIADIIQVDSEIIRLPTVIERNMLSNLFPIEFPSQTIWEWAEDKLGQTDKKGIFTESKMNRIITSGTHIDDNNTFGNVRNQRSDDDNRGCLSYHKTNLFSFRPMITFPTKK